MDRIGEWTGLRDGRDRRVGWITGLDRIGGRKVEEPEGGYELRAKNTEVISFAPLRLCVKTYQRNIDCVPSRRSAKQAGVP